MTIARPISYVCFSAIGLAAGALWSPLGAHPATVPSGGDRAHAAPNDEKLLKRINEEYGEETAEFVKQFDDLSIQVKKYPINAAASPDGRFVIRLFGSDETIASELRYPIKGNETKLVREYSFSSGGKTFCCNFTRTPKDPKITEVHFSLIDENGGELVYVDSDGDGRWDRFVDYTQKPPKSYHRDGLCWKERADSPPKEKSAEKDRGKEDGQVQSK